MYTGLDQLVRERVRREQKREKEKGQKRLMEAKFKLQDTTTAAAAAKLCCPLKTTFAPLLLMFDSLSNAILEHWQAANSGSSYRVYLCVLFLLLIFCFVLFCVRWVSLCVITAGSKFHSLFLSLSFLAHGDNLMSFHNGLWKSKSKAGGEFSILVISSALLKKLHTKLKLFDCWLTTNKFFQQKNLNFKKVK